MSKAYEIFRAAFDGPRDLRSDEYKNGVIDTLRFRLGEAIAVRCGYRAGSAQADAYFAGCDEGRRMAREYLEKVGAADGSAVYGVPLATLAACLTGPNPKVSLGAEAGNECSAGDTSARPAN